VHGDKGSTRPWTLTQRFGKETKADFDEILLRLENRQRDASASRAVKTILRRANGLRHEEARAATRA
jgi:hypothetical protein